ncbi:Uma2 family endonuclease [Amycolatopsis sp. cmx-4-68]|uniref:Uma2 family endonuclease n=1 Tax=Amycolatopsis sp. cmx-4-68 TaxID=2790938 RepID=UPI0039797B4A
MAAPTEHEAEAEFHIPLRPDGWTVDEVLALPEDQTSQQRIELVDGALLVSPWPRLEHQRLVGTLWGQLAAAAGKQFEVFPGANVVLGNRGNRLLIPDLVVTDEPGLTGVSLTEQQVRLVVEIVSPSSRLQDRILKRIVYAEALISFYLLVEPGEQNTATLFEIQGEDYVPIAKSKSGELHLTRPFEATLRL